MAARSIGSGTISFGLVSIPVKVYVATQSQAVSFNMLHEPCGSRIKQQLHCPTCERVVERREIVKGYQFAKERYVTFGEDELKALEAEANRGIEIEEFVPLADVDPVYFASSHYLGPETGAEKAYQLLIEAMRDTGKVAVAQYTSHGKEHMVLIRPCDDVLALHTLYYANEVRSTDEIKVTTAPKIRAGEVELAHKLIDELSAASFQPDQYASAYRDRVQAIVDKKIAGEEITVTEAAPEAAQVIDLVDALKQSLARKTARGGKKGPAKTAKSSSAPARKKQAARGARRK